MLVVEDIDLIHSVQQMCPHSRSRVYAHDLGIARLNTYRLYRCHSLSVCTSSDDVHHAE